MADYGVPKEVLTDNGRQYTNWRGKTRFEQELEKDRVKHIRSRPHHPMTLGKIERFWKSLLGEFLQRAQFDSFEQAVERTALWVKYYNHKRPHQGIGGLCPADRFFEIAHELRQTIEKGLEENALELALRGRPVDPFYMVGRMGGQSVVIRAEKGKVRMLLDGESGASQKELVYDARKDIDHEHDQNTRRVFDPQQKITAVLSIWSERRTSAQLCQEMDISPALLGQWQNLAIEGMLRALDPKQKDPLPPINQRLSRLIEKKLAGSTGKLEKRLRAIQKNKAAISP